MRETERGENAMNVIVAVDENWGIGKDGDQLVYLSQDLKRFKALTTGHPVILGRKTLATFPGGRPLKGRRKHVPGFSAANFRYKQYCQGGTIQMEIKHVWAVYFSGTGTTQKVVTSLSKSVAQGLGCDWQEYCFNLPNARERYG